MLCKTEKEEYINLNNSDLQPTYTRLLWNSENNSKIPIISEYANANLSILDINDVIPLTEALNIVILGGGICCSEFLNKEIVLENLGKSHESNEDIIESSYMRDLLNGNQVLFVPSYKGKIMLYYQDFLYRMDKSNSSKRYYRCRKSFCNSRGVYFVATGEFINSDYHNHINDSRFYQKLITMKRLKDLAPLYPHKSKKYIYDLIIKERLKDPDLIICPEALPSYKTLERSIGRCFQKI